MATTTLNGRNTHHLPASQGTGASVMGWMREQARVFETWMEQRKLYRETVRELNDLSDKELDDIGIARSDITRIARQSAARSTSVR